MRTNIELNEDLLVAAKKYSRAKTKRALVEEALQIYIAVKDAEQRKRSYKEQLDALRNRLRTVKLRTDSPDIVRQDRDSR
jgi:Arc/MetJ family transcription regulator